MLSQKIQDYIKRKELSNKAKKEFVDLLRQVDFNNEAELYEIVAYMFGTHPDVINGFILTLNKDEALKIKEIIDYKNPNKALHVYVAVVSLFKIGCENGARNLLESFIADNAFVKKINKQVFIGLEKVFNYQGAEPILTEECSAWNKRNISGFRKIWLEAIEYLKNDIFTTRAQKWFKNNKIILTQKEAELLHVEGLEKETNNVNSINVDKSDLKDISVEVLLEGLSKKINSIQQQIHNLSREKEDLLKQNNLLKEEILNIQNELRIVRAEKSDLLKDREEKEDNNRLLKKEIEKKEKELNLKKEEIRHIESKLVNVESAYGQAGKTEVDALIGNIKSRLASEYEKYKEIKSKAPDMDYYEMLISMLDEIYRVLKKNGINF